MSATKKISKRERDRLAYERHREVGEPPGYEGPCWGPTPEDYAFVDAPASLPAPKETQ